MSIVAAMIDSREPAWVQALTFGSNMVTVTPLAHGDLLATVDDGTLLAVERKTISDLLGSIRDGRLWAQLAGIRELTPWAYLVVTGALSCSADGKVIVDHGVTGWAWASLQGALLRAQELGVLVTFAWHDNDYEAAVICLAANSHTEQVRIEPQKIGVPLGDGEQILAAMPGVGLERVASILEYTKTVGWALTFLTHMQNGVRVPGIGMGIKRRVRKALGLKEDEELSVIATDTGNPKMPEGAIDLSNGGGQ